MLAYSDQRERRKMQNMGVLKQAEEITGKRSCEKIIISKAEDDSGLPPNEDDNAA